MAARATWKGYLRLGELVCGVGLYTAVSASDRVSLHMVNRKTGNRLSRLSLIHISEPTRQP